MRNPITSRNAAFFAAGAFAAALFVTGVAHAITDTVFKYSTPQTGYLTLLPAAFSSESAVGGYLNSGDSIQFIDTAAHCFVAGVDLPQGSKIMAFTAWYVNQSTPQTQYVILRSTHLSDGASSNIKFLTFNNTSGARTGQSAQINPAAIVDRAHYGYSLLYCTEDSTSNVFYGARITFTYNNAGD